MSQDRWDRVTEILNAYNYNIMSRQECIKKIENLGFQVIFPIELTETAKKKMGRVMLGECNAIMSRALIVDKTQKKQYGNVYMLSKIADYYYSNVGIGIRTIQNVSQAIITTYFDDVNDPEAEKFRKILKDLGYTVQDNNEDQKIVITNIN